MREIGMDAELLARLATPGERLLRRAHPRDSFMEYDQQILSLLETLLLRELTSLHAQSCYDVDDYFALLVRAFPDARDRPFLSMRSVIRGDRLDIFWARFWKIRDPSGRTSYRSRSYPKGTRSCRQSMRPFRKVPRDLRRIVEFMERRNEIKRKRGRLLGEMLRALRQYAALTGEDVY